VRRSPLYALVVAAGTLAFVAAVAWPTTALVLRIAAGWRTVSEVPWFGSRLYGLLWRGTWLSMSAVALCLTFSIPGVFAIGRMGPRAVCSVTAMLATLLFCPPIVCVFGWDRAVPAMIEPHWRCIFIWATWAWPIPALIVGRALAQQRHAFYEAARLDASRTRVFLHIALPNLRAHLALCAVLLFVLFFNDYGVPATCGLTVLPTDLLGRATSSRNALDTIMPALPAVGVTMVALAGAYFFWNRAPATEGSRVRAWGRERARWIFLIPVVMFLLTWAAPVAALSVKLTAHDVQNAVRTYSYEIPASIGVAVCAGAAVFVIALSTWQTPRLRKVMFIWAVIWGIVPGAVVGQSLIAGYDRAFLMPVYDHGAILVLAYVARFAWVGLAAAGALHDRTNKAVVELAAVDGATPAQRLWHVILPVHGPMLAAASALVTALAVAELPVSTMIRPPGLNPISAIIIEKFHRFEYGLLIALCLVVVGVAVVAALLLSWSAHRLADD